jgi:hypothetical protein
MACCILVSYHGARASSKRFCQWGCRSWSRRIEAEQTLPSQERVVGLNSGFAPLKRERCPGGLDDRKQLLEMLHGAPERFFTTGRALLAAIDWSILETQDSRKHDRNLNRKYPRDRR